MRNEPFRGRPREEPLDWEALARRFDAFVGDPANGVAFTNSRGEGAFTAFLEGSTGAKAGHELVSFGPIALGRLLLGMDASDLLPSLAGYFSEEAGIYLNNPGGMRIEMWYLVYIISLAAHLTVTALGNDGAAMERLRRSLATLRTMAHRIGYDFGHQGYDFSAGEPWTSKDIYRQEDAIGGYAYLMLLGHEYFGEPGWLTEAEEAIGRYLGYEANPWYEVPCGAMAVAAAARLAARGRAVDVSRAVDFLLDPGAGLVVGEWGGREANGLYRGWRHSTPESAYSLETLVALPLILPAARYVPELAPRIAAYALHTAANARLFYSEYTRGNESRADLSTDVPYERLYRERGGRSPYAGHKSVYGGACSLWWGALVHRTEVPHVLRLDLGKTDFLRPIGEPGWLYYNPWDAPKTVNDPSGEPIEVAAGGVRLVGRT
jgi:hypothetical protein